MQNLTDAMTLSCDVLATECDGRVPFVLFMNIYRYLATEHYTVSLPVTWTTYAATLTTTSRKSCRVSS